jgi:hypothetical protein
VPTTPDDLSAFAYPGDLAAKLKWLADLASPENWEYRHAAAVPDRPYPVLVNYLKYTFKRLSEEKKIVYAGEVACFNTGLVTPLQEEVFAFLEPNEIKDRQPWFLAAFCPESDRRLVAFSALPERAQYFDDPSDLLYDFRRSFRKNLTHIIEENKERFPEPYRSDSETHRLRIALEGAIDHALKRVRQNYKTAVPQFYWPRGTGRGQLQLLLPLCMTSPSQVDLALTVNREGDVYLASTVLTLDMAYNNARLIARPDSDWLAP